MNIYLRLISITLLLFIYVLGIKNKMGFCNSYHTNTIYMIIIKKYIDKWFLYWFSRFTVFFIKKS